MNYSEQFENLKYMLERSEEKRNEEGCDGVEEEVAATAYFQMVNLLQQDYTNGNNRPEWPREKYIEKAVEMLSMEEDPIEDNELAKIAEMALYAELKIRNLDLSDVEKPEEHRSLLDNLR